MTEERLPNIHPGEILLKEFIEPRVSAKSRAERGRSRRTRTCGCRFTSAPAQAISCDCRTPTIWKRPGATVTTTTQEFTLG